MRQRRSAVREPQRNLVAPPSIGTRLQTSIRNWRPDTVIGVGLLVVIWIAYAQVRNFSFLRYDDPTFVTENIHLRNGLTLAGLAWAFKSTYAASWFPLTWCSYMIGIQLYGFDPGWHHLTNVLLHSVSAILLYGILRRLTGALWRSAFVAFIFALHPAHIEPVAWVAERKEVLSGLFWFLTIWIYVFYLQKRQVVFYLLLIAAFGCGLMSKPMIVTLPFALLLLDVWPLARVGRESVRRLILEKLPLFALALGVSIVTLLAQRQGQAVSGFETLPLILRIQNALLSYAIYVLKFFWPAQLSIVYPFSSDLSLWQVACAALFLAAVTLIAIWQSKQRPYIVVGWFWFIIALIPVIGLVQVGVQSRADRYTYIPYIGLAIALAWTANDAFGNFKWRVPALAIGSVFVCTACLAATATNLTYWRNGVTLFQHAVDVAPRNWVAQNGLAQALIAEGRINEAIPHVQESIRLQPNAPDSHIILGDALNKQDDLNGAEHQFRVALMLQRNNANAEDGLGMILTDKGEMREALVHLKHAIDLYPDDPDSHYNLGRLYALSGKTKEAVNEFARTIQLKPDDSAAHYNLGTALAIDGRLEAAYAQFLTAVQLNPNYAKAHLSLGAILARSGHCDRAVSEFRQVLQIEPGSVEALNMLEACSSQR